MNFNEISYMMNLAQEMARKAFAHDEVPIGAIVVDPFGKVLSRSHNLKENRHDPSAHAEVLAIRDACAQLKNWRLENCSIYVTLEPCPMCLSLIQQARLSRVYFGAYDPKGGALSLGYDLHQNNSLNHKFDVIGGIDHYNNSKIMSDFFKQKRTFYSN
jgi:tRNA(adenine34) deaminase